MSSSKLVNLDPKDNNFYYHHEQEVHAKPSDHMVVPSKYYLGSHEPASKVITHKQSHKNKFKANMIKSQIGQVKRQQYVNSRNGAESLQSTLSLNEGVTFLRQTAHFTQKLTQTLDARQSLSSGGNYEYQIETSATPDPYANMS